MARKNIWMMLGLGMMLAVSRVAWADAWPQPWTPQAAAPQAPAQTYTGQVESIKIDHCDQQPGTCEGSLVLAQGDDQQVDLAIPAGTVIQRGPQRVHLEELGLGNYVTVRAVPLAGPPGPEVRDGGSQVGTNLGERAPTLGEATEQ